MITVIDWKSVVDAIHVCPDTREKLKRTRNLPPHANDRISFIRALSRSFAKDQPIHSDPLMYNWNNSQVFKAAVWSIGSNMRDWDQFLSTEQKLKTVLFNYDPVATTHAISSGKISISLLAPFFRGTTQTSDAKAVIKWAKLLADCTAKKLQYYDFLKDVANIFAGGLAGNHILPAPYRLPELAICLAGYCAKPATSWTGQAQIQAAIWSFLKPYKWSGMGFPLGIEFLRNLGWPAFKPDRHIERLFQHWLPNHRQVSELNSATTRIAAMIGTTQTDIKNSIHHALLGISLSPPPDSVPLSFADNLLWSLGKEVETKKKTDNPPRGNSPYIIHNQPFKQVPFRNLQIVDCAQSGWDRWVNEILQDMTMWELQDFEPVGKTKVLHRLSSLQSIILMPKSLMQEVKTVCPGETIHVDDWWDAEQPDPQWQREMDDLQGEMEREREPSLEKNEPYKQDIPGQSQNDAQSKTRDASPKDIPPYGPEDNWDELEDSESEEEDTWHTEPLYGRDECRDVIIEKYGIYVPSLARWLEILEAKNPGTRINACLGNYLAQNSDKTGPAILLCPDLIKRIPKLIRRNIEESSENNSLPDGGTATMFALRMILLHELGHHVYPSHHGTWEGKIAYGECLANWFVHQLFSSWEQELLNAFTKKQTFVYRLYQGMVAMRKMGSMERLSDMLIKAAYENELDRIGLFCHFDSWKYRHDFCRIGISKEISMISYLFGIL